MNINITILYERDKIKDSMRFMVYILSIGYLCNLNNTIKTNLMGTYLIIINHVFMSRIFFRSEFRRIKW